MMLDLGYFAGLGQDLVEMPFPTRRILTVPVSMHSRPVQDTLDPASDTAGSLSFCCPDRLQNLSDMTESNVTHL